MNPPIMIVVARLNKAARTDVAEGIEIRTAAKIVHFRREQYSGGVRYAHARSRCVVARWKFWR